MLYDLELRLKNNYGQIPLGFRRLWIATSAIWLVAYLILNWSSLALLWDGVIAMPSTTCAQVYSNDEDRRSNCEATASNGRDDITFYTQGKSHPFRPYFQKYRHDEKLLIWLGAPIAWLALIWSYLWVRRGFQEERPK